MSEWQPIETAPPTDSVVLISVSPTEENKTFSHWGARTHPAYVDELGNICDVGTGKADVGFIGTYWKVTHWMPLPSPPKEPEPTPDTLPSKSEH